MHVNVIMGGQLDEHLLFWQPTMSIHVILYVNCTVLVCLFFDMKIKYDDDDDDEDVDDGVTISKTGPVRPWHSTWH